MEHQLLHNSDVERFEVNLYIIMKTDSVAVQLQMYTATTPTILWDF